MIAFDTTFLIDYLDAEPATEVFLQSHESKPFFTPSLSLFEVYRGAARTGGSETVDSLTTKLDWIEPLPLTHTTAREAAVIEAELLDDGEQVNLKDILIAGVCRHHGARLVTRDADFDRIDDLQTLSY
jgi:predicted nucleic acid-binding protein